MQAVQHSYIRVSFRDCLFRMYLLQQRKSSPRWDEQKRYVNWEALFAYAVQVSMDVGFNIVLVFKARTSELLDYCREFGVRQVGSSDPF